MASQVDTAITEKNDGTQDDNKAVMIQEEGKGEEESKDFGLSGARLLNNDMAVQTTLGLR